MSKESGVVICPNPKCHRKIEEPILLNNLSTTPAEQYQACPFCFIKLDVDVKKDEDSMLESTPGPPANQFLEKVLDVISAQPQMEKKEKEEKRIEEEPPLETPIEEEPPLETPIEEEPPLETPIEEEPPLETPIEEEPPLETPIEEEPPLETPKKKEKGPSGCPHHFGYLTSRPRDAPIPQECLTCTKIVDCMLKLRS